MSGSPPTTRKIRNQPCKAIDGGRAAASFLPIPHSAAGARNLELRYAEGLRARPTAAFTQQEDGRELAKKVPFQMNWDNPVGPNDQPRFLLNLQPVMPFTISEGWNLVARITRPDDTPEWKARFAITILLPRRK